MKTIIKVLFLIFLLALTLYSCKNGEKKNPDSKDYSLILNTREFVFNHQIDSLLQLFVTKADCNNCFFEIYIDKRDVDEVLFVFRASNYYPKNLNSDTALVNDYFNKRNPMFFTKIKDHIIFIYVGIEELTIPVSKSHRIRFANNASSSNYEYSWVIKKDKNKYTVFEKAWTDPFSTIEFNGVIKFVPPSGNP